MKLNIINLGSIAQMWPMKTIKTAETARLTMVIIRIRRRVDNIVHVDMTLLPAP